MHCSSFSSYNISVSLHIGKDRIEQTMNGLRVKSLEKALKNSQTKRIRRFFKKTIFVLIFSTEQNSPRATLHSLRLGNRGAATRLAADGHLLDQGAGGGIIVEVGRRQVDFRVEIQQRQSTDHVQEMDDDQQPHEQHEEHEEQLGESAA